ncbi:MAG: hypothetical protein ACPHID_02380 [Thermoplasmatota archaeon]
METIATEHRDIGTAWKPHAGNPLFLDDAETALYAALKLQLHSRAAQGAVRAPTVTVRRAHRAFNAKSQQPEQMHDQFTDFLGASPYWIRERMSALNHGTFLREDGRRSRGAIQYRWEAPISDADQTAFEHIQRLTDHHIALIPDLRRIWSSFGEEPFGRRDFLKATISARKKTLTRRWYELAATKVTPTHLAHYLAARLDHMVNCGLVAPATHHDESLQLTRRGLETMQWVNVFLYSPGGQEP